jgi:integrase
MALRDRGGKWHYRFKLDGREYSQTTDLAAIERNRTRAQELELEHRRALRDGQNPVRRVMVRQFSDAAQEFLEWAKVEYREHPNSARRLSVSFTSAVGFFGATPVSLIDADAIEKFKMWRLTDRMDGERFIGAVRDITLRHDLHALSVFFQFAMTRKLTRFNPVTEVDIPSDESAVREHILTAKEEKAYFPRAAKYPDLHDVARLILNQGMRPEEVTGLAKTDVDLDRGQVAIRKGKSKAARRTLTLTAESKSILARRLAGPSPWVFPSKRNPGKPITRVNGLHDKVLAAAAKAGMPLIFVLYDLRHTFATRAAMVGTDIATLAAILGHSGLRSVMRYVHIGAEHRRAAMLVIEQAMTSERGLIQ